MRLAQMLDPALGFGKVEQQHFFDPTDGLGGIAQPDAHFAALGNDKRIVRIERVGAILMKAHLVEIAVQNKIELGEDAVALGVILGVVV